MNTNESFDSSADCMDGRSHAAIARFAEGRYVDDVCSGAGTVGVVANPDHPDHEAFLAKFRKQVAVSYGMHGSRRLLVSGHSGCAGHKVDDERHKTDILKAAATFKTILGELGYDDMEVVPIWNTPIDGVWTSTVLEEAIA